MKPLYDILPTRDDILARAVVECLDQMYRLATPSITWKQLLKLSKQGATGERTLWQDHYYLPIELKDRITQWFINAYNIDYTSGDQSRFCWELFNSGPTTNADTMISYWKTRGHEIIIDEKRYNELTQEV